MEALYAGVDLGGTKIACGLATANGKIVTDRAVATESHEGPQAVITRVANLINALSEETGKRPAAIGIGARDTDPEWRHLVTLPWAAPARGRR